MQHSRIFLLCMLLLGSAVYAQVSLTDSLIAYYPLNGNAQDSSGNGHHGTIFGGATPTTDRFGNPSGAYEFDGVDDFIELLTSPKFKPQLPVSICAWVKPNSTLSSSSINAIFANDYQANVYNGVVLHLGSNVPQVSFMSGGFPGPSSRRTKLASTSLSSLQAGVWYLMVGVMRNTTDMDIYVNCANVGGQYNGAGGALSYSSGPGSIGAYDNALFGPPTYFSGTIDDVRFYHKSLSAQEIAALYNFPQSVQIPVNIGKDTTLCVGESRTLNATSTNALSYTWNTGATTPSITVNASGTYSVLAQGTGCNFTAKSVNLTFSPLEKPILGNDTSFCSGNSLTLQAAALNAKSYLWQNGTTAATQSVSQSGTYIVTATNTACTIPSTSDTIEVTVVQPPSVQLGNDTLLCQGASITLQSQLANQTSQQWQNGSTQPTLTVSQTGKYFLTASNTVCPSATDSIQVTFMAQPAVTLGKDTTLCQGTSLLLNATTQGATGYTWQNGSSSPTLAVTQSGTYSVSAANAVCPPAKDTILVTFVAKPVVKLGKDTSICQGNSVLLNAQSAGATGYLWQNGSTAPTQSVSATGIYTVLAQSQYCAPVGDTIVVNVQPKPVVSLGKDTAFCVGNTLVLNAFTQGGTAYTWQDGATTSNYTVSTSGTYSVSVSSPYCPAVRDTIVVGFNPNPTVSLGNDTVFCGGTTILQAISNATKFLWNTGATTKQISATAAGTYSIIATNAFGCIGKDTVNVGIGQPATAIFTPVAGIIPSKSVINLQNSSINAAHYLWEIVNTQGQVVLSDTTQNPTFTLTLTPGNYTLRLTVRNNCGSNDISQNIQITDAVSISEAQIAGIALYPNPASDHLTVRVPQAATLTLTLFDAQGKRLRTERLAEGSQTLLLTEMPAGIYAAIIQFASGESYSLKLIIQ